MTQKEKVLRELISGAKVTRMTMFFLGVGNGPEVIRKLREIGVQIKTKEVREMKPNGVTIRYGSYTLENKKQALKQLKTMIKESIKR